MAPVHINAAVFCEDYRSDGWGKHMLIGAFPSGVRMQAIPGVLLLALYVDLENLEVGEHTLPLRVVDGREVVLSGRVEMRADVIGAAALAIGPFRVNVGRAGKLKFQLELDGRWETIKVLSVSEDTKVIGPERLLAETAFRV